MATDVLANRYAQAMVEIAADTGGTQAIETIQRDLDAFLALMDAGGQQLGSALESPVFTIEERRAVLDLVLPRLGLNPLTQNLLRLVNDKRRFPQLRSIAEAFRDMADARANRARVTVQTAQPLTAELEAEVRRALERATGKDVVLETQVKPDLIGGLVARIGDTVYDSSLRTRLQQLKESLLRSPVANA